MELWAIITVTAAFIQNLRSSLQKYLKGKIGTSGATFVRFGFGLPFAFVFLVIFTWGLGHNLPEINSTFIFWVIIASVAQIIAQSLLIALFAYRNFTVGTAYSRTEPVQAVVFGLIFLEETVSLVIIAAIIISVLGVMLISVARTTLTPGAFLASIFSRTTAIGLLSGTFFGLAAVGFRGGSLSLGGPNFLVQASFTLCAAILLQTVIMLIFIAIKDRSELRRIAQNWRPALAVGLFGASASFGWFSAFTLEKAAIVKALAQVEMLFTFASSIFIFREKINFRESIGCIAIVAGILVLLLA